MAPDPTRAFMVASRTPIVTTNGPAGPGAMLDNFDPKADARHLESGAVVEVAIDPNLIDDLQTEQDDSGESAASTTPRRRRQTTTKEPTDAA